ncbi:hypothetical protein E3N88_14004 [Mikania micrantha]|uniref:OTU domain-containing protein n=1 Tax=Mikania micrantha TaxID=192012 RepID=A0A5N6P089_9ASTR|nr:hypothetical protein E3N88_14004 [Mikania micrantha]
MLQYEKQSSWWVDGMVNGRSRVQGIIYATSRVFDHSTAFKVQKDTHGRPTLKAQKQKEQDVVKDTLASQESTFEPSRHSLFTAVNEKSQKPVFRRSRSTSVSKAMPPSDSLSQNEHRFPRNMKPEGLNNVYRFGRHILPLFQPYVINIQDIEPDGNCGFRSVAVGLGFDKSHWAFIRQQLLHELDFNADMYRYVFNSYDPGSYDVLRNTINWQHIAPTPAEHWMFIPHTGLVIAQRFGVIVHLFSSRGPQTIFPLWTSANSLPRHNVISVVYLGVHFINVTLQGYYPMPTVNPIWKRYLNDTASDWEFVYHDKLQEYQRFIDENKAWNLLI